MTAYYSYHINLDERGDFNADVRNSSGKTIYEIMAGISLGENESSIFDDGFMKNKHDLEGLTEYLQSLGVIESNSRILTERDLDKLLEDDDTNEMSM